jgi:ATP-dependent helicase HrpB
VAAVLFDEFHERSLDADLGLAFALDAQAVLRPDLRLLVMSATLDGARVAGLLGDAPVIESQGRAFPVETRHLGRDPVARIEDQTARAVRQALGEEPGSLLVFLPGQAEIRRTEQVLSDRLPADVTLAPLYGALAPAEQDRAIDPAPLGRRKVVLATSIAETSLTIEGVQGVIDAGLSREPRFRSRLRSDAPCDRPRQPGRRRPAPRPRRSHRARRLLALWPEPETRALRPFARPEILDSDLSRWRSISRSGARGTPPTSGFSIRRPRPPWPKPAPFWSDRSAGRGGRPDASRAAWWPRIPLPPRLAHMVVRAAEAGQAPLAAASPP